MSNLKNKLDKISTLETKRKDSGLTESEEKEYCKLNSEVSGIPEKCFTKEYSDKLTDIIQKTDDLLNEIKKQNPKIKFQKLPRKSLDKGNEPSFGRLRSQYKFGEVYVVYDKKRGTYNNKGKQEIKPWFLYYPSQPDGYTGGFSSKKKAMGWYENKGR